MQEWQQLMHVLTAPPPDADALTALYARMPDNGMAYAGVAHREQFDIASDYNEDWSCAAIAWQAGGAEQYDLQSGGALKLGSAGAITLARGVRYAYRALGETPFHTYMIAFPHWITAGAQRAMLDDAPGNARRLETRLIRPDVKQQQLMDAIATHIRQGETDDSWYTEKSTLLYASLLDAQDDRAAAQEKIGAIKPSTRAELARRCGFAKETMLQRFGEKELTLNAIAREARLSPYHLIRVFKTLTGATPMQFLSMIRMDAALRLIKETALSSGEVANAVGYGDRTAFFRAFRKHYGCAPSAVGRH